MPIDDQPLTVNGPRHGTLSAPASLGRDASLDVTV
jgi:hypothetical protein